jgi:nitroimidazol reductase NimA-like FMN-containing flavoprotein (pyridoxamine 5'-phosphate oxidase superfamily)
MSAVPSERTRVRRLPEKAVDEVAVLHTILDSARVAHVAFLDDGHPVNIPTGAARDGDRLLLHGSTGSRLFRRLAAGAEVCVTTTLSTAWCWPGRRSSPRCTTAAR